MRLAPLFVLAFAAAASAQAPDTLDWHRYYPLAVGNVWEYHDAELWGVQFRHTLLADTVVGGRTYFVRRTDYSSLGSPVPPGQPQVDYVRYDEGGGGVVAVPSLGDAAASVRPCTLDDLFERDLRLGFGTRAACDPPPGPGWFPDSVFVEGQYNTTWRQPLVRSGTSTPIDVAAIKQFTVGGLFTTFVADIGPVRAGNLNGPSLHYAVIDGVTYGTPEIVVAETGGPLTVTDALASIPTDHEIALANLTVEPVVLDSLVMRFSDPWGFSTWSVQEADAPYALCYFAPFLPEMSRCAPDVTLMPGAVVPFWIGYDPCAICHAEASVGARRGGAPDTLLVYSGGVAVPDTVWFDDSNYVSTESTPGESRLSLSVGPNPSAGLASVTITAAEPAQSVRVVLLDALGRRVAVLHDGALPADARLPVPPGLPAGVYTVRAEADDASATARLTVVR